MNEGVSIFKKMGAGVRYLKERESCNDLHQIQLWRSEILK